MTNYREILRLHSLGIHKKDIAKACGCSRNTVASVLKKAGEKRIEWEAAQRLTERQLAESLFPKEISVYKMPDYEYVHRELAGREVTLSLLWMRYCQECHKNNETPYKKTQFIKHYFEYVRKTKAAPRVSCKPGEIMETGWSEYVFIDNAEAPKTRKAYIFMALLPYSGYMYAEAFLSINDEVWARALANTYEYFGGTTHILLHGNPAKRVSSGICVELAEYYKTAIIPDSDTAMKASFVKFIAALKENICSFQKLNVALRQNLIKFNSMRYQKDRKSRPLVFKEERQFLFPLPKEPFATNQKTDSRDELK